MNRAVIVARALLLLIALFFSVFPAASASAQEPIPAEPVAVHVANPALVPLATSKTGKITVAGVVDQTTLQRHEAGGELRFSFELSDGSGNRTAVLSPGRPPYGFAQTEVVVVVGEERDGVLAADQVLLPGAAAWPDPNRGLRNVMVITMIVWIGLFSYLLWIDQKTRRLEER